MVKLTREEKLAVSLQINSEPSLIGDLGQWLIWLLPVVGFGVYGIYQQEPVAIGLAFVILLSMAVWFLVYSQMRFI